ncbi:MAG: hypothetical protein F6K54_36690 [Okeania sp. SIO3B5]|nr:hypothetical protein [Okeania sp. SIO3B5]
MGNDILNGNAGGDTLRGGKGNDNLSGDLPSVTSGAVDINAIRFVRIVDIPGNGSFLDATGDPIFDPWPTAPPTATSGGFDLGAIGVINVIKLLNMDN